MNDDAALPLMLVLNPGADIVTELRDWLHAAFGDTFLWSRYSRPVVRHPRMRPHSEPRFQLIMIDVSDWVGDADTDRALKMTLVPKWLEEDVLPHVKDAFLIVLAPARSLQAVTAQYKNLNRDFEVLVREPVYWEQVGGNFSTEVRALWEQRKGKLVKGPLLARWVQTVTPPGAE